MTTISNFRGDYFFLSNFYECAIHIWGMEFTSAEAAYQASKCTSQTDMAKFVGVSPRKSKYMGRKVLLPSNWDEQREGRMYEVLSAKFSNEFLKKQLLLTGERMLVEGNSWGDVYWGECRGKGRNVLGKLLMQFRQRLREQL